ncbi:ribonuclease activity regulator RraA [Spongiimicrobium sp. 3-5]|uniref:ribonuclease activity regulator RraA n=1 Tax=Spongiimicrobium sp. 3-5 TaxID=3332596 RepID=UPI003980AACE
MEISTTEKLKQISTATVATCLFKRGLRHQYIQNVHRLQKRGYTMVGKAFTLRYIPAREDLNPIEVFKDPKHLQRVAIETCPQGAVLVIDSRKDARAASAGAILISRLMTRGAAGIVTDGSFRDSREISELDFPAYHQRAASPTNLTLHQAIAINDPIGCGDVSVFPNDIIIGDDDGVMVIPANIADDVANECWEMTLYEQFVMEQVRNGKSIIGLYPLTDKKIKIKFEKWNQRK